MTRRSVYMGLDCLHCGKRITVGRSFLGSTYYVTPPGNGRRHPHVSAYSMERMLRKNSIGNFLNAAALQGMRASNTTNQVAVAADEAELEIRIAYHRACVERIVANAPDDPAEFQVKFDEYRAGLLEQLGLPAETCVETTETLEPA